MDKPIYAEDVPEWQHAFQKKCILELTEPPLFNRHEPEPEPEEEKEYVKQRLKQPDID